MINFIHFGQISSFLLPSLSLLFFSGSPPCSTVDFVFIDFGFLVGGGGVEEMKNQAAATLLPTQKTLGADCSEGRRPQGELCLTS